MPLRKEARGSPLFSYLNGVQVVAGSNPAAPTTGTRLDGQTNNAIAEECRR